MTLAELRAELAARGYSYLTNARIDQFINRACARLDGLYHWPYREDSAQGTAPLSIPTLGQVEAVSNETGGYPLAAVGYRDLVNWGADLDDTGSPAYWYRATPDGAPVVATYPTSTDTIGVQFWRTSPTLTVDGDTPLAPARYHLLIADIAQQIIERERSNHANADGFQGDIDRQVAEMVNDLLVQQEPMYVRITGD